MKKKYFFILMLFLCSCSPSQSASVQKDDFISGAIVALASSLITLSLTFVYNMIESSRKREWEKEDKSLNKHQEILEKRLLQIEESLTCSMSWLTKLVINTDKLVTNEFRLSEYQSTFETLVNTTHYELVIMSLDDDELIALNEEFSSIIKEINKTILPLLVKSTDPKKRMAEIEALIKIIIKADDPYIKMIKRLDYLRNNKFFK